MTTTLSRVLIATALLGGTAYADGVPRRVAVLDFDGPRALAETGRDAVVRAIGEDNDLIPAKRWVEAKSTAARTQRGARMWSKAARQAGVDALVEGWVQAENRQKVLTVVVSDAATGKELDHVTIRLGADGVTEATLKALRQELADRLDGIEPVSVPVPDALAPVKLGTEIAPAPIGPQLPPAPVDSPSKTVAAIEPATTVTLEPKQTDWLPEQPKKRSQLTPRARVAGGVGWASRSLTIGAEGDGVTQYAGVGAKQLGVEAAFYPFPSKKRDGVLSGVGFSFGVSQSLGSTVTFDDGEEVGDYNIDQHALHAAVHYRAPLGEHFAIDGEVGYGRQTYNIDDAPSTFEVPNTSYHYLHAGTHLDLAVTERASVGFGGKLFHVMDTGDLSSVEWYGPGSSSGLGVDANFVIPLPANLYVRGELNYTRIKTSFDGVGVITEDEGAYEAVDSNVGASVKVGIEF